MKKISLTIAILAALGAFSQSNAFELSKTLDKDLQPDMSIVDDDSGITVSYTFKGAMY